MADKKEKDLTALAQSSSVTSDSFIRMVDKDGKSVKIARDIFLQAIRDALPGVLSSLGGTATQFLGKTSSGGIGYETLVNAAALLGAIYRDLSYNTDLNNVRECGFFCAGSRSKAESLVNMPSGFTPTAGLVVIVVSGYTNNSSEETWKSYCTQFLIYKKQVFIREYTTGTWSTWSTMI